jgi:hypothetical protein
MAQTGVPFGEVAAVRNWLGISAPVGRPEREHPARPVTGFACPRSEVSGRRVWGWARKHFGTAERFFARFFIANYCPLLFLEGSGRNLTPDRLPASERRPLEAACDAALGRSARLLAPQMVGGVGAFAARSAARALAGTGMRVEQVLHRARRARRPIAAGPNSSCAASPSSASRFPDRLPDRDLAYSGHAEGRRWTGPTHALTATPCSTPISRSCCSPSTAS